MDDDKIVFFDWYPAYAGENLTIGSDELSVFCPILTPMYSDQYMNSDIEGIEINEIKTNGGDEVGGFIDISSCVKAKYFGRSNFTIPHIHKGESVLLSPIVNGTYYWKEVGINDDYRLTEKVTLRAANKLITVEQLDDDNTYSLTLDTVTKNITLKASNKTGEGLIYTIKMDVAASKIIIEDSVENSIILDSKTPSIKIENNLGTKIDANKIDVNIEAPGSINLKAGTYLNIEAPAAHIKTNVSVVDSSELAINSQATVVTSPIVGVNGSLNVTGSVIGNAVLGGVVSCGASASTISPCTVDDGATSGSPSGASAPAPTNPPSDAAASFNQLVLIMTNVTTALTSLGGAILAANAEHKGEATAPSADAVTLVGASTAAISSISSTMPSASIPLVKGENGPL